MIQSKGLKNQMLKKKKKKEKKKLSRVTPISWTCSHVINFERNLKKANNFMLTSQVSFCFTGIHNWTLMFCHI